MLLHVLTDSLFSVVATILITLVAVIISFRCTYDISYVAIINDGCQSTQTPSSRVNDLVITRVYYTWSTIDDLSCCNLQSISRTMIPKSIDLFFWTIVFLRKERDTPKRCRKRIGSRVYSYASFERFPRISTEDDKKYRIIVVMYNFVAVYFQYCRFFSKQPLLSFNTGDTQSFLGKIACDILVKGSRFAACNGTQHYWRENLEYEGYRCVPSLVLWRSRLDSMFLLFSGDRR